MYVEKVGKNTGIPQFTDNFTTICLSGSTVNILRDSYTYVTFLSVSRMAYVFMELSHVIQGAFCGYKTPDYVKFNAQVTQSTIFIRSRNHYITYTVSFMYYCTWRWRGDRKNP